MVDLRTLAILDVNHAAVDPRGHWREELLAMAVKQLQAPEALGYAYASQVRMDGGRQWLDAGIIRHRRKDPSMLVVQVYVKKFCGSEPVQCTALAIAVADRIGT